MEGPWGLSRYGAGPHPTAAYYEAPARARLRSSVVARFAGPPPMRGPPWGGLRAPPGSRLFPVLPRPAFSRFFPFVPAFRGLLSCVGARALDTIETSATFRGARPDFSGFCSPRPPPRGGLLPPPTLFVPARARVCFRLGCRARPARVPPAAPFSRAGPPRPFARPCAASGRARPCVCGPHPAGGGSDWLQAKKISEKFVADVDKCEKMWYNNKQGGRWRAHPVAEQHTIPSSERSYMT